MPADGEAEITAAFEQALAVRGASPDVAEVADRWFFENVVRVHRAGEGASYTGLKPAGLDVGPVIPAAERAIETGSPDELVRLLTDTVAEQVELRLDHVKALEQHAAASVAEAREHVEAMLGLQVWSHKLYLAALARAHGDAHGHHG